VHAEVLPWIMSTDFGADSSSLFPFRARTDRRDWTPYSRRRLYSRRE